MLCSRGSCSTPWLWSDSSCVIRGCACHRKSAAGDERLGREYSQCPYHLGPRQDTYSHASACAYLANRQATHSTSIMAGLDQEMPGASDMNDAAINAGIAAKNITEAAVDDSVTRILTGMFLAGVMDKYAEDKMAYDVSKHSANVTSESAAQLARELSANSTVLLKNEGGVLPLTASDKVAVIGLADQDNALTHGGGSGQVTPSWTITPLAGISAAAGKGKSRMIQALTQRRLLAQQRPPMSRLCSSAPFPLKVAP